MRWRTVLGVAVAATLATVGLGYVVLERPAPAPAPGPDPDPVVSAPTDFAAYDLTGVAVVRGPFCDRVSPTGVEHALGDAPADSEEWTNGERERLPDGSNDRVQEYGCRWTAADGSQVEAWVFAPPVTRARARLLATARPSGCRVSQGTPFGRPSSTVTCDGEEGSVERYAGLFGDAWLTCSVLVPLQVEDLESRTEEWCVEVVEAARS